MKHIAALIVTLVLTACGGGGGGGGATTSPTPSSTAPVLRQAGAITQNNSNLVYNTAVGDVNGDGLQDIVVSGWNSDRDTAYVRIFTQNADGSLQDSTSMLPSNAIHGSQHVFIADFDNDGKNDIWLPGFLDGTSIRPTTSVMFWGGNGAFTRQDFTEQVMAHGACIDDLNNDGKLDMVVAGGGIYFNNGNRTFTLNTTLLNGNNYFSACAVAHQSNGNVDILLGNNYYVAGYHNNINTYDSSMNFITSTGVTGHNTEDLINALATDVNGDGHKDFIAIYNDNGTNTGGPVVETLVNIGANSYSVGSVIDHVNNEYHGYLFTLNGTPSVFLPSYNTGSRVYQITANNITPYKSGDFTSMCGSASWCDASAVYVGNNKVFMFQLQDQYFYTKEML